MIDANFRYFVVNDGSFVQKSLGDLEEAGSIVCTTLANIEADKIVPVKLTLNREIKAISAVPENRLSILPHLAFDIEQGFARLPPHVVNSRNFISIVVPSFIDEDKLPSSKIVTPVSLNALYTLGEPILKIGSSPNFLARISQNPEAPDFGDTSKATLTIHDFIFQPEAYQVFGAWIIKLPQYVPLFGNDYTPPQCSEVALEKITEMTMGLALTEFRHDHMLARERVMKLKEIKISGHGL